MAVIMEFRWASEVGRHGMPYPEELEYLGFTRVRPCPNYPTAWLMVRLPITTGGGHSA